MRWRPVRPTSAKRNSLSSYVNNCAMPRQTFPLTPICCKGWIRKRSLIGLRSRSCRSRENPKWPRRRPKRLRLGATPIFRARRCPGSLLLQGLSLNPRQIQQTSGGPRGHCTRPAVAKGISSTTPFPITLHRQDSCSKVERTPLAVQCFRQGSAKPNCRFRRWDIFGRSSMWERLLF